MQDRNCTDNETGQPLPFHQFNKRTFHELSLDMQHIQISVLIGITAQDIAFKSTGLSVCIAQGLRKDISALQYLIINPGYQICTVRWIIYVSEIRHESSGTF